MIYPSDQDVQRMKVARDIVEICQLYGVPAELVRKQISNFELMEYLVREYLAQVEA